MKFFTKLCTFLALAYLLAPSHAQAALRGTAIQANTTTSATVTVTVSSIGIQANDIVLLIGISGGSSSQTPTFPSGFTSISGLSNISMVNSASTVYAAWHLAGGSEPTSYTVTPGQTDFHTLACRVYSGRNTSSPFTATSTTAESTTFSFPLSYSLTGLTAATSDDIVQVLAIAGTASDTQSFTQPSGYGNVLAAGGVVANSPSMNTSDKVNSASGATGALTGTVTDTSSRSSEYAGYVISLAIAGAATGAPTQNIPLLGVG